MCDFAADAEAARQLLVGRVLTVERVRQLNAKDYFSSAAISARCSTWTASME